MLRLALIENLRRVSARITTARMHASQAQRWADQMTDIAESDPKSLILVIADMARSDPPMVSPFVAELVRRLQDHGLALALPLTWVEQRLAESSLTIEQMVQSETQQQAADQVSVSNTIGSLRSLGAMDWRVFVETLSLVEQALREDPPGAYRRWTLRRATATGTSSPAWPSTARCRSPRSRRPRSALAQRERREPWPPATIRLTSAIT